MCMNKGGANQDAVPLQWHLSWIYRPSVSAYMFCSWLLWWPLALSLSPPAHVTCQHVCIQRPPAIPRKVPGWRRAHIHFVCYLC